MGDKKYEKFKGKPSLRPAAWGAGGLGVAPISAIYWQDNLPADCNIITLPTKYYLEK